MSIRKKQPLKCLSIGYKHLLLLHSGSCRLPTSQAGSCSQSFTWSSFGYLLCCTCVPKQCYSFGRCFLELGRGAILYIPSRCRTVRRSLLRCVGFVPGSCWWSWLRGLWLGIGIFAYKNAWRLLSDFTACRLE